jgi:hypothetical protein
MEIVIDSLQDDPAFDAQLASANALIALVLRFQLERVLCDLPSESS